MQWPYRIEINKHLAILNSYLIIKIINIVFKYFNIKNFMGVGSVGSQ